MEVTRRGEPVAVLISIAEYGRLTAPNRRFWDELEAFRAAFGLDEEGLEPEAWLPERSPGVGRPVDL